MNLFVGLDVSSEKFDACFLSDDANLTILEEITLGNDIDGATTVKENHYVHGINFHTQFSPAMFFNQDKELKGLNTVVTIENLFRINQFRRMFDEDKTDRNDAFRIADF